MAESSVSNPTVSAAKRTCERIAEAAGRVLGLLGQLDADGEDGPLGPVEMSRVLVRLDDALDVVEQIGDDLAEATE